MSGTVEDRHIGGKIAYISEKDPWPTYISVVKAPDYMTEGEYDLESRTYYMKEPCRDVSDYSNTWECSECGAVMMLECCDDGDPCLYVGDVAEMPSFCPNCGRKVKR